MRGEDFLVGRRRLTFCVAPRATGLEEPGALLYVRVHFRGDTLRDLNARMH